MVEMLGFFLMGCALGLLYMEALRQTVLILPSRSKPMRFLFLSFVIRLGALGLAFYFILQSFVWYSLGFVLAGFLSVRTLWLWLESRSIKSNLKQAIQKKKK